MTTFGQGDNNLTSTISELTDNSIDSGVGSLSKKEDGLNRILPSVGSDNGDNKKNLDLFAQALNRTQENPSNRTQKDRLERQINAIKKRKERFPRNTQEIISEREQAEEEKVARELNVVRNQVEEEADKKGNRAASTALAQEIVKPKSGTYHKNWLIWMQLMIRDTAKSDNWLETFKAKGKRYRGLDCKNGFGVEESIRPENNSGANAGG